MLAWVYVVHTLADRRYWIVLSSKDGMVVSKADYATIVQVKRLGAQTMEVRDLSEIVTLVEVLSNQIVKG